MRHGQIRSRDDADSQGHETWTRSRDDADSQGHETWTRSRDDADSQGHETWTRSRDDADSQGRDTSNAVTQRNNIRFLPCVTFTTTASFCQAVCNTVSLQ